MILRYFYDTHLAQASYLVGCARTGEALVIDPSRAIHPYLAAADQAGLRITHVTETHIHADFVSGTRELAAATGAHVYLSAVAQQPFGVDTAATLVRDGDTFMVGNVRVDVLQTPGHTPEHIVFMITDTANTDQPMGVFTGDFLFAGDIGRPDLLEKAVGAAGTAVVGAHQQFANVRRFAQMPDYLHIWPGHGAGSACGKALGAVPSTTLGYEKLTNPAFQMTDEQEFVDWLLSAQPEPPRYFAQMKRVNFAGPALLRELPTPVELTPDVLQFGLDPAAQVIDLRAREAFAAGHVPGALSVPATSDTFSTYVGWYVDYGRPVSLVLPQDQALDPILAALRAIGVDQVVGYTNAASTHVLALALPTISAAALAERMAENGMILVDVRGQTEYQEKHIVGTRHIPLGYLPQHLAELPTDRPLVLTCASGYRSHVAASYLHAQGMTNAITLTDGMPVWEILLPTESGLS